MIQPVLKDDALIADVHAAGQGGGNAMRFWWLGQSGFLIQWRGRHLLLDPYLSDSLTKKYASTDKPHIRMTERAIDPANLNFIDVVTSSHNHTDHLDAETLGPLLRVNPGLRMVAPEANRQFIADRLGIDAAFPFGLAVGESLRVDPFEFHAVPAAHEELGPEYLGYVIRFGPWTIYHSGDTLLYEGMAETLRTFAIDVAFLPINGRAPERRVAGNLSAREAAELGKAAGVRVVVPCHYEMFAFNTADPTDFVAAADSVGQEHRVLRCGERCEMQPFT